MARQHNTTERQSNTTQQKDKATQHNSCRVVIFQIKISYLEWKSTCTTIAKVHQCVNKCSMMYHYEIIQSKKCELVLKVNTKVKIFRGVYDNVDEIHTRHLEVWCCTVCHEVLDEFFKSILFSVCLFEVIYGLEDFNVASLHEADCC